jgi:hypothetical protein
MVALVQSNSVVDTQKSQHDRFLAMLPQIRRQASIAFRNQRFELREELIQEVVANCYRAWVLLVRRGKEAVVYPTPLAQYAIRQVRGGRRVGGRLNFHDILSPQARRHYGITIERIDRRDPQNGVWNELLVEDQKAGPAETAAARLDLTAWLGTLTKRNCGIAKSLALGETTNAVAKQFGLSAGRVSQLRVWLQAQWEQFQGGPKIASCLA